jgi:hypothetical protein
VIPKLWELKGWKLHAALFTTGFLEDICFVVYLVLVQRGEWVWVMFFVYAWQSMHDLYYCLDQSQWRDTKLRRFEKIGSALGAAFTVKFFPNFL